MLKRMLSVLLATVLIFTSVFASGFGVSVKASSDTKDILTSLATKFPHGKYWNHMGSENNPDKVTDTPCADHGNCNWVENSCNCNSFDNAIQCMGYAHKIAYEIVGSSPRNTFTKSTTLDVSKLRVGDIIRYRWNGHSICVTGVNGTKISFTDCNWIGKCQIRWDVMDVSDIVGFTYVLHHEDNNRKNKDIYFFQNVESSKVNIEEETAYEEWKMMQDANLNIRATRSVSANVVGQISGGTTFKVYDKYFDGEFLWGKILVGTTIGWCALNYSEYIEGSLEKPNFTNKEENYLVNQKFTLKWSEVPGATAYTLYIYNSDKKLVKQYSTSGTKKSITLDTTGKYYVKVKATNDITPSWKSVGKQVSFNVVGEFVRVKSVSVSKTSLSIAKGGTYTLKTTVKPSDATNTALTYTSSNTKVATVSSGGKITAKGFGKTVITVKSNDTGAVAKCTVTVIPGTVTNIKQTGSSTGTATATWKKVSGATKYVIYKYNNSTDKYEKYATTTNNTYKFSFTANKSIKIKIYAYAKSGDVTYKSAASAAVTLYSGTKIPALTVKSGKNYAKLSWEKVSGATGYIVYMYKNGECVKIATVSSGDTTSYTKKGLTSNKTYTFRVRAIKQASNITAYGSYSKKVSVKVK